MSPVWQKSSHSHGSDSDCVELARLSTGLGVRDSKAPQAGHLSLPYDEFAALLAGVRRASGANSVT
ncbi:DUF397 domain-containing protein [Spirillospora sp. NPDC052269]